MQSADAATFIGNRVKLEKKILKECIQRRQASSLLKRNGTGGDNFI